MKYVTKLGAYGLAVAAAFAVALAVLVSVSTTQTAEAADVPLAEDANAATAAPGDTVQIAVNGALAQLSITGTGDGVGASFAANDGQSISCSDDAACDENKSSDLANPSREITVELNVDADSGEGYILVSVLGVGGANPSEQETKVITVSKATLVGSLKVEAGTKTVTADGGTSTIHRHGQERVGYTWASGAVRGARHHAWLPHLQWHHRAAVLRHHGRRHW